MQDRIPENRPLEDRNTVVDASTRGSAGGWAVALVVALLLAVGVFYFANNRTDGVDPNTNTSSIGTQAPAPATVPPTDGQATGTQPAPAPAQPAPSQPAQ